MTSMLQSMGSQSVGHNLGLNNNKKMQSLNVVFLKQDYKKIYILIILLGPQVCRCQAFIFQARH